MILDAGPTRHGLESTVLEATSADVALLRPGAVTVERIEAVLGRALRRDGGGVERPTAPGQLESHYATARACVSMPSRSAPAKRCSRSGPTRRRRRRPFST